MEKADGKRTKERCLPEKFLQNNSRKNSASLQKKQTFCGDTPRQGIAWSLRQSSSMFAPITSSGIS